MMAFSTTTKSMMAACLLSFSSFCAAAQTSVDQALVSAASADEATTTIYSADFKTSEGGFTTDNEMCWKSTDPTYGWKGTGFIEGSNLMLESNLTSGEIDLSGYSDATFSFSHVVSRSTAPSEALHVEILDGDKVTEVNDQVTWPAGTDWNPVNSGEISLKDYVGKKIRIQFHYTSTTLEACIWAINSLTITGIKTVNGINEATTATDARPDFSRAYEVYTIDGRRGNGAATKGVKIIKQGNKTWKMIR